MTARISLTTLKWALLAAAALACLGLLALRYQDDIAALLPGRGQGPGAEKEIVQRLIVYRLDEERSSNFTFTQPVTLFRVITHPVIKPGAAGPGVGWNYAVRMELFDSDGALIADRKVFSRSMLFNDAGQRIGSERFYRDSNDIASQLDEVWMASQTPIAQIRIRSADKDPDVTAVDVRVAERRPQRASDPLAHFRRYSPEEQSRLARANAFPVSLLTPQEVAQSTFNKWLSIGPAGIGGRDYDVRLLYVSDNFDSSEVREEEL